MPPTATPPPTAAVATPVPPTPSPEPVDTGWQSLGGGLEVRRLYVQVEGLGDRLWLARVDPAQAHFRVLYAPSSQRTVRGWLDAAHPRLVVNGGYFTPEKAATALVVSDGARSEQSYVGFGGMFAVHDGQVEVRSLAASPYSPSEPLEQAVQAFPMLVQPGGFQAVTEDDGKLARRTVVGQDRAGRIVFLLSAQPLFSLKTLSAFLAASDLDLDTALNLDGGTSSGLWYTDQAGQPFGVDSWVYVPAVIVVE
ncbi:MAG: phosphodiester glycosidase family protein [Thermoflexales bacterium]|nr:phosphodiester glycosidase family protein [Thermoflexales bacterium]